jgi:hypothetical protein
MKWLMAALMVLSTASAFAGNELGNGGDSFAQEFVAIGRKLAELLENNPDPAFSAGIFQESVKRAAVSSKDKLELRGAEVDAINYPESGRIEINRSRWKEYGLREKTSLVFHEYLGVAGVDDSNYEVSGRYVGLPNLLFARADSGEAPSSQAVAGAAEREGNRQFFVGLSGGLAAAGGNLGKLYGISSEPTIEGRIGYNLDQYFTARASIGSAKFFFTADPNGAVDSNLLSYGLAIEAHLLGNPRVEGRTGFDLYAFAGADRVDRRQNFQMLGFVEKDSAFGLNGGGGLGYFLSKQVMVGAEGRIAKIFFKDRFEQTYWYAGVLDMTGPLFAANASIRYFF